MSAAAPKRTNGASASASAGANGAAAPADAAAAPAASGAGVEIAKLAGGKPDAADNTAKLDALKKEIDSTHEEINNLRSILSGSGPSKDTPEGKRRAELRAELDEIRGAQAGGKGARGKIFDEIKNVQEGMRQKLDTLKTAKSKANYKSTAEVDAQIQRLEASVDGGKMKLVDEKRALSEISQLRKSRKAVEAFGAQQDSIDADKARIDELKASLDDPASKAQSKRYDEVREALDALQKEADKAYGSRSKLLDQRTALSKKLDELYAARKERQAAFRTANDVYYAKVTKDREARHAAAKEEQRKYEEGKRKEHEAQMREDAALPAFAKEIEDCEVLINYFSGNSSVSAPRSAEAKAAVSGAKALEVRQVEADASLGRVVKKKGESEEDAYFLGGGGKKGKKGGAKKKGTPLALGQAPDEAEVAAAAPATSANAPLNVPLGTLSALLALSIPPPTSSGDVPRVVDNLKLKREYFVSNQAQQTRANIEKVEKALAKSSISDEASTEAPAAAEAKADA
ncbi:hypothetical protein FA09DRAFT_333822 [Tilletiopsis washingtonensis]|uniref:Nuclear segregation protein Bfr1 n=1 Tax=Tilletiopsis washingtonensis TaxID=58919 RepID=A0A316ZES9_9BASI|nr:hypothetical protein FA09DRAFT_333822 [Tilletiopsis washingtonensis]PWN99528.1 hypothetical protein FA09DRAFT_333822 [Tilletiopsis washingtonensis]